MARRKLAAEMNVVPYIDVMLVLLVIFMITAPLLTQGVDVDLPDDLPPAVKAAGDAIAKMSSAEDANPGLLPAGLGEQRQAGRQEEQHLPHMPGGII